MPNWFQAGCAPPFAILGTSGFGQIDEKTEVIENNKKGIKNTIKKTNMPLENEQAKMNPPRQTQNV